MSELLPDIPRDFSGIFGSPGMQAEINGLRDQLSASTARLTHERFLATQIHQARTEAIAASPALRAVFDYDGITTRSPQTDLPDTASILASAFLTSGVEAPMLPEGFAETTAKQLRQANHPDRGNNTSTAQDIAQHLSALDTDPTLAIARAMTTAPTLASDSPQDLRTERYRLQLALTATSKPLFTNEAEAQRTAETEIQGTEWRVRTSAALKSFMLITGGDAVWNNFLQGIVDQQNMYLINMVNRLQPQMLALQERLVQGNPIPVDRLDLPAIDAVFEHIWGILGPNHNADYSPPYQNWLEILLPAMRMLDPGEKPGEEYHKFEPPIRVVQQPIYYYGYGYEKGPRQDRNNSIIGYGSENNIYNKN